MGKIARVAAHVKNVTVDPISTGVMYTGRGIKFGALKVKSTTSNMVQAVKTEEQRIDQERAVRKQQELQDLVNEVQNLKATVISETGPTKKATKPRSTPKATASPA